MIRIFILVTCFFSATLSLKAVDYYWVGGTGNWSDTLHWATTSGGNIFHGQIPQADDDVWFDANSFLQAGEEVVIDVARAVTRDLVINDFGNAPIFRNTVASTLEINGGLSVANTVQYQFTGRVVFSGNGNHSIRTGGHILGRDISFSNPEGVWTVLDDLSIQNTVFVSQGSATFLGDIECAYLHVNPDEAADNCSSLFEGDIFLSGNNTTSGGQPFEPLKINRAFANVQFEPNSTISLTNTAVTLSVVGDGAIQFPNVEFTNSTGVQQVNIVGGNYIIQQLSFGSTGFIHSSGTILDLSLAVGRTYSFGANQDFTIENIQANGSCENSIYLISTVIGTSANIFTNTTLRGDFLNIRDLNIASGNFMVTNGKDLGNNSGWDINDLGTQTLYWIGGEGLWQDQNNWSYTSGGVGGACIPTPIDNVVFDDNSFNGNGQVVELSAPLSYCRNMTWVGTTGVPIFRNVGLQLNVSGSLTFEENMQIDNRGIIRMNSFHTDQTILSASQDLGTDFRIEGIGSNYELLSDFYVRGRILHVHGGLTSGGHDIRTNNYFSNYTTSRRLDLSNGSLTLEGGRGFWDVNSTNYTLLAAQSTIQVLGAIVVNNRGDGQLYFSKMTIGAWGNVRSFNSVDARFEYLSIAENGFLSGNQQMDTLRIHAGYNYDFNGGSTFTINRLESIGDCNNPVNIKSNRPGREAIFQTDFDNSEISYTQVQDIHVRGAGRMESVFGVDNGNTTGWIIPNDPGRDLYWVGNSGDWNDVNHWSLTSGGPGGACIPTSIDNVIFDQNSFSILNQVVRGGVVYFHDMTWAGVVGEPAIDVLETYVYGSLRLDDAMEVNRWNFIRLSGNGIDEVLDTRGKTIVHLWLNAEGQWSMEAPFNASGQFFFYNGGLITRGHPIIAERIRMWEADNLTFHLGASRIDLFGSGATVPQFAQYQSAGVLNFDPGTSNININHPDGYVLAGTNELSFHNLNFTPTTGQGRLEVRTADRIAYSSIEFNNDGLILDEHIIDTLIFSPGHTYTLQSNRTQTINQHLQVMGSPCDPIILNATSTGSPATIQKTDGLVRGDYIQMRDQIGDGTFNAGQHSTNVANSNTGWVFESIDEAQADIGVLGPDTILCRDSLITIDPYPFHSATYAWSDGDTAAVKTLSDPGLYWVDISLSANCTFRDTILIEPQIISGTDLGIDTTLCEGQTLDLNVEIDGGSYEWNDGSTDSRFQISSPGIYSVEVLWQGCVNQDTISVQYNPNPVPNLGDDQFACRDENIVLSPNASYDEIIWSDGSSDAMLTTSVSDTIWVEIEELGCITRDSIIVTFYDHENFLGPDTNYCEGTTLRLDIPLDGLSNYRWNDGSTNDFLEMNAPGVYSVEITREDCRLTDTVVVNELLLPRLELPRDTSYCEGDVVLLDPNTNADSVRWSTNAQSNSIEVDMEGNYTIEAWRRGCMNSSMTTVFMDERPTVDFGPDTSICVQRPLVLSVNAPGATLLWNDGGFESTRVVTSTGYHAVTINRGVCSVLENIAVVVEDCLEFKVFTPNAISPNNDGNNDEFLPFFDPAITIHDYELKIFDRWGNLLFVSDDVNTGWDGTWNGTLQQGGTYVYAMRFEFTDELESSIEDIEGSIALIR